MRRKLSNIRGISDERLRECRRRAWMETRNGVYIVISTIAGTVVAIILAFLLYG